MVVGAAAVVEECEQHFKDGFRKTVPGGVKRSKDILFVYSSDALMQRTLNCQHLLNSFGLAWADKTWERLPMIKSASCVSQHSAFGCIS